jgi:hypothetical protein
MPKALSRAAQSIHSNHSPGSQQLRSMDLLRSNSP